MAEIVLWNPPEVRPSFRFLDEDDNVLEEGPLLTADEVFCDLCNAEVPLRPVPMNDSHALCLRCLHQVEPEWPKQVPFEVMMAWYTQLEEASE